MADAEESKTHWTQTPAGRKRMAKLAKNRHRKGAKRGKSLTQKEGQQRTLPLDHHTSYLFGKFETVIEYYARSNNLPLTALAEGVAELLRNQKGR